MCTHARRSLFALTLERSLSPPVKQKKTARELVRERNKCGVILRLLCMCGGSGVFYGMVLILLEGLSSLGRDRLSFHQ